MATLFRCPQPPKGGAIKRWVEKKIIIKKKTPPLGGWGAYETDIKPSF